MSIIILSIALIATLSYIIHHNIRKKPKKDERRLPKQKKQKKPKVKKQRKKKKSRKFVEEGFILCPYCSNKTPSTTEYCPYCGTNLKDIEGGELTLKNGRFKERGHIFEEEVDIIDIKDKQVIVNILRIKGQDSQKIEVFLKETFENEDERDLVRSEIARVPTGTFSDFIKSYENLMKKLGQEKPEFDFDNENYFNEGKGR